MVWFMLFFSGYYCLFEVILKTILKNRQKYQRHIIYLGLLFGIFSPVLLAQLSAETTTQSEMATANSDNYELPPLPEDNDSLASIAHIFVKNFVFKGNHVFSDATLSQLVAEFENRNISAEELQAVKNKITRYYIDAGYINSGAIIPDQQVDQGIIVLNIIEGRLVEVEVSGHERLQTSYIQKRIRGTAEETLNIKTLQERLQLLQQNPRLKRINAELGPGIELGEGILKIDVEEMRPYQLDFRFNNHRSPSVGAYRGEIIAQHLNLSGLLGKQMGFGDSLYLRYGLTEGLDDYTINYTVPLNRYPTLLTFNLERSDAEVVEEPFKQINIESEADTYAIALMHPFYRTSSREFNLGLKVERRSSQTFLLGRPFPFSPGVGKDGESKISVIRFSQDWLDRSRVQVIAARSSLNFGIDAWNATINEDDTPDSRFITWLGQFQWVRRLEFFQHAMLKDSQLLFRTDIQWANEGLLPLEKFSIGGATTVRGYRENQLTRDNGWIASLEWRLPVAQWRLPKLSKNADDGMLYLAPFIDYGRSWNHDDSTTSKNSTIYSVGLGLRWQLAQKLYAEVYWGAALHDEDIPEATDDDLQDDGIHFEVNLAF